MELFKSSTTVDVASVPFISANKRTHATSRNIQKLFAN